MKRILIYLPRPVLASAYYRAILPYRHCKDKLLKEGIILDIAETVRTGENFDAIVLQREVPCNLAMHVNSRRRLGCRYIWNIDDDFWNVPEWSYAQQTRAQKETIDLSIAFADQVWCSTAALAKAYKSVRTWNEQAVLSPLLNLADLEELKDLPPINAPTPPVNILWAGSGTHTRDLQQAEGAILAIAKHYDANVRFHFLGYCPEALEADLFPRLLRFREWVELADYHKTIRDIQPHVAICPVVKCPFNEAKSSIKWFEQTLAGAAVICSKGETYSAAAKQVENTTAAWEEAIGLAVEAALNGDRPAWYDRDLETIGSTYTWQSSSRELWLDAFRGCVK